MFGSFIKIIWVLFRDSGSGFITIPRPILSTDSSSRTRGFSIPSKHTLKRGCGWRWKSSAARSEDVLALGSRKRGRRSVIVSKQMGNKKSEPKSAWFEWSVRIKMNKQVTGSWAYRMKYWTARVLNDNAKEKGASWGVPWRGSRLILEELYIRERWNIYIYIVCVA